MPASPSANAPPSPNRLRASRKGLTVLCVSERPRIPNRLLRYRPIPCPQRTDAPVTVDTSRHFCPHTDCDYRGWLGLDNLRANGHPSGGPWRQFHCTSCKGYFLETHGTLFHGKQAAVELIVRVLACLAEGLGIRATARVFEVDPNTVLHWLVEAAEQLRAFSALFSLRSARGAAATRRVVRGAARRQSR